MQFIRGRSPAQSSAGSAIRYRPYAWQGYKVYLYCWVETSGVFTMLATVSDHLGQLCCMALLIIGVQAFRHRVQYERLCGDARRLRGALTFSLRALRKLYEDNLVVLAGGRPPLISGRNQIALLRLHLGRLICLDVGEIEAVLAASIAAEEAETAMAIAGKRVRGVAFTVPEGSLARGRLESVLMQACSKMEAAERLMTPSEMRRDARAFEGASVVEFATHALRSKRRRLAEAPQALVSESAL
jgi:hypothetical protein